MMKTAVQTKRVCWGRVIKICLLGIFVWSFISFDMCMCAEFNFVNSKSAFVAGNNQAQFKLANIDALTGWHHDSTRWSQNTFKRSLGASDISLWAFVAQDGDIFVPDQSSGAGYLDPSRFYIPEDRQVHITQDTLIDGQGQTLTLEPHGQIVVDNDVTLTLRNMKLEHRINSSADPIINLNGAGSKLALENVELALTQDFYFGNGQLFVHGDVLVSGHHAFWYRSAQASYICDGATFGFDKGSTFFYNPSSEDNHLIQMQSDTSTMFLDGATLVTTYTGIKLSTGTLCCDNNVILNSLAERKFLSPLTDVAYENLFTSTIGTYDGVRSVAWSPDGKYLAIGANSSSILGSEVQIYRFDDQAHTLTLVDSIDEGNDAVFALDWSSDGKYLAVGTGVNPAISESGITSGDELQVFRFDELTQTLTGVDSIDDGKAIYSVSWSPNGSYLVVGTQANPTYSDAGITSGHELQVFRFDVLTQTLTGVDSKDEGGVHVRGVSWAPDGKYLGVGTNNGPTYSDAGITSGHEVQVFRFDYGTEKLTGVASWDHTTHVNTIDWSFDGKYLAACQGTAPQLHVYTFDAATERFTGHASINTMSTLKCSWSPEGHYVITGGWHNVRSIHYFDGTTLTLVYFGGSLTAPTLALDWGPDGNYIAVGTAAFQNPSGPYPNPLPSDSELHVYRVDYVPQAVSTGIIFGDSSIIDGSGNLDVHVLGGAHVDLQGIVVDDSV